MGQELDGGDIGVPKVDITEGSDVGVRGGCNDETGQGFIGVMVPVKEAEQFLVILDSISNCCCRSATTRAGGGCGAGYGTPATAR